MGGRGLGRERREQQRGLSYIPENTALVVLQRRCWGRSCSGASQEAVAHGAQSTFQPPQVASEVPVQFQPRWLPCTWLMGKTGPENRTQTSHSLDGLIHGAYGHPRVSKTDTFEPITLQMDAENPAGRARVASFPGGELRGRPGSVDSGVRAELDPRGSEMLSDLSQATQQSMVEPEFNPRVGPPGPTLLNASLLL